MHYLVSLLGIGAILAILASSAWKRRPRAPLDPLVADRLGRIVYHEPVLPRGPGVLQLGISGSVGGSALGSAADVALAKHHSPSADLHVGSPHAWRFDEAAFSTVVWRYADLEPHKDRVLRTIHRWLEPGGLLYLLKPYDPVSRAGIHVAVRHSSGTCSIVLRRHGRVHRIRYREFPESPETYASLFDLTDFDLVSETDRLYVLRAG